MVIDEVSQGKRLEQPLDCPDEIYTLMKSCWSQEPEQRPTFVEVHTSLIQIARPLVGEIQSPDYNTEEPIAAIYNV